MDGHAHAHHLFSWDLPMLVLLAATLAVYTSLARRSKRGGMSARVAFAGGLALVFAALWAPLVSLVLPGSHLAYMLQMEALIAVSPVLLLFGLRPLLRSNTAFSAAPVRRLPSLPAAVTLGLWLLAVYAWHLPLLHALSMQYGAVYALQLLSFLAAGLLFWWPLILPGATGMRPLGKLGYLAAAQAGAGVLAAMLVWSPELIYHHQHGAASLPWGISGGLDQRLSGAVMMVTDMLVASTVAGWIVLGALTGAGGRDRPSPSPAVE